MVLIFMKISMIMPLAVKEVVDETYHTQRSQHRHDRVR